MKEKNVLITISIIILALILVATAIFVVVKGNVFQKPTEGNTEEVSEHNDLNNDDNKIIKLTFVGDCMPSSNLGSKSPGTFNYFFGNTDPSYFFEKVSAITSVDDFTIANCETVLSDRELTQKVKNYTPAYWYKGPSANAKMFSAGSVEVAGLCNNHTKDYGQEGYEDTIKALEAEGIMCADAREPLYLEKDGKTIGIYFCDLWSVHDIQKIIDTVTEMKDKCDWTAVYFHGGEMKIHSPENWKVNACHKIIDAGADFIIGAHSHTLQPYEEYNGGYILYSIGNFCYGGSKHPENRTAMLSVDLVFNEDGTCSMATKITPCYVYTGNINNWQPTPIEPSDENYQKIIDFMAGKISSPL